MTEGEPVEEKDVLVVGAGLAGYKAAQDLAQLGLEVLLVERRPHMGGALDQHDRWFPTDDCSWCKTLPLFAGDGIAERCLRRQLDQPGIELAPATRLQRIAGEAGHFTATLETDVDVVDPALCTACGRCAQVCPVTVPDEFEEGLADRKAAYIRHPLAVPSAYSIDLGSCTRCGKCQPECPTGAIDFARDGKSVQRRVNAKVAVITTGFTGLDPRVLPQYRWGAHPDIYTQAQFERHVSGFQGLARRSDGGPMERVAILHCIGSRDKDRDYCSSACCMVAAKEALMVKELAPAAEVTLFYMDMRDQVRDGHAYHQRVRGAGVRMVRARPSAVELGEGGQLMVVYADEGEGVREEPFDAVVLQMAQAPAEDIAQLADAAGVDLDAHGFIARSPGTATETSREGVFVAGSAGGPKDIPDTVIGGRPRGGDRGLGTRSRTGLPREGQGARDRRAGVPLPRRAGEDGGHRAGPRPRQRPAEGGGGEGSGPGVQARRPDRRGPGGHGREPPGAPLVPRLPVEVPGAGGGGARGRPAGPGGVRGRPGVARVDEPRRRGRDPQGPVPGGHGQRALADRGAKGLHHLARG